MSEAVPRAGLLLVVSGPSGAGKTTLSRSLVDRLDRAVFSVSATTRPPRGAERDGVDYHFIDDTEFDARVEDGSFLEWAVVHGSRYGTLRDQVEKSLGRGLTVVLDIDVQGAMQVRRRMPGAVLVFVSPPTLEELSGRLRGRMTETEEERSARLEVAVAETRLAGCFDYFVLNDGIEDAVSSLMSIQHAESARIDRLAYPALALQCDPGRFSGRDSWRGLRVLITAGPTREHIDPVRFLSNRSSGRMGYDLAIAFREAGAAVALISGPAPGCDPPGGVRMVRVETAAEMLEALEARAPDADLLAMAAAVSDFRPVGLRPDKIGRASGNLDLRLEPVPDLLAAVGAGSSRSAGRLILAFALEDGDLGSGIRRARDKMLSKGADAVFLNMLDSSGGPMESPVSSGVLLSRSGVRIDIPPGSKRYVAEAMVAALGRLRDSFAAGGNGA